MSRHVENLIVGQGLAGSAMAWTLHWSGQSILIIDRDEEHTASRVAAGLVTPVTGKRLVKSPEYDDYWSAALNFYRRVEQETQTSFFAAADMIRLFEDEVARSAFLSRSEAESVTGTELWQGSVQTAGSKQVGITMTPAGRLNVKHYLQATRSYFAARESYQQQNLCFDRDISIQDDRIVSETQAISADRLICCQGVQKNPLFPSVPNNPSRGDILTVRIPEYERREVVHRSVWIAPNPDGSQTVGSTYDWKNKQAEPTAEGRAEVMKKLGRIVKGIVAVESHVAGVRPTMKDYEPVTGCDPKHKNVLIFNGLGSKGTLRAPLLATELLHFIQGQGAPRATRNVSRLFPRTTSGGGQRALTTLAQEAVQKVLGEGDIAIDATVGNCFDTCFLSRLIGETGQLIGFDVQQSALEATRQRVESTGLTNVKLLQQGHETLNQQVAENSVSAVMFNLGYLPRHDHKIITQPDTSTQAIKAAIKALKPDGVMTVLAYRGHVGGQEEFEAVHSLLLDSGQHYDLQRIDSTPAKATSPVLFVFRKRQVKEQ